MNSTKKISEKLLSYGVLINNSITDRGIADALNNYGYSPEKMNAIKDFYEEVDALVKDQLKEYGDQYEASAELESLWMKANKVYTKTLKIARLTFKDNLSAQSALLLQGGRKKSLYGWLEQSQTFYNNLKNNEEFLKEMANYAYTPEKLAAEKALIDKLEVTKYKQEKEKGNAQQTTFDRDNKIDKLDEMVSMLKVVLRISLEDKPQWLEKVGILKKS